MKIKKICAALAGLWSLALPIQAMAYETETHDLLTRAAIQKSVIYTNPNFMKDLGWDYAPTNPLATFPTYQTPTPTAPTVPAFRANLSAVEAIAWGAWFEDNVSGTVSFNHFFDPQANGGLGRQLTIQGQTLGSGMSPDWILEYRANTFLNQYYSFAKGQRNLYTAFAGQNPSERLTAMGKVFQTLGHVVHHVQDMAQPQHVRNEPHLHFDEHGFVILLGDYASIPVLQNVALPPAAYELYTRERVKTSTELDNILNAAEVARGTVYPIPALDQVSDYWFTRTTNGQYKGMAEFTARNFVTMNTPYFATLVNGAWKIENNPDFPLPNGTNVDGTNKQIVSTVTTLNSKKAGGAPVTGAVNYITGKVYDGFAFGTNPTTQKLAVESVIPGLTGVIPTLTFRRFQGDGKDVWEDGYKVLFPRAVAFSAGLINHFFRGRVALHRTQRLGVTQWIVANSSDYQMNGRYTVLAEDSTGVRTEIADYIFNHEKYTGSFINLIPPSNAVKLVLVFSGTIGTETDRVAGIVIPYDPVACPPPNDLLNGKCVPPPTPTCTPPQVLQNGVCVTPPPPSASCAGPFYYPNSFGSAQSTRSAPSPYTVSRDYILEMGASAGTVSYNGWTSTPQTARMDIYADNASLTPLDSIGLTGLGGAVGAATPFNSGFSFNPGSLGTTRVRVRISSSTALPPASELQIGVSCPGGGVNDLTTTTVGFGAKRDQFKGACGLWTFTIDGTTKIQEGGVATLRKGSHSVTAVLDTTTVGRICLIGFDSGSPFYRDSTGDRSFSPPATISVR